ncbi:MAG: S49 family peptidase, partial [Planctomycetes bacterium]|nr:S49 family peptidase [Planctomycetota bacterium]
EVMHVGNFKTAFENYSHDSMSAEQRESISHLLDEFYGQMLDGIATNRGLTRSAVEALFDKVFVTPEQAKSAGLISDVGYEDQYKKSVEALVGGKFEVVKDYGDEGAEDLKKMMENPNPFALMAMLPKLLNPPKPTVPDEPCIAIVYATGEINSGKSQRGFSGDVSTMGCDTIVKALEKTLENDNIKAVVFRVNSPGGSAIASDMIWRAIQRVREKKPVVASMGYVAGSGGYWISMGCDKIIAQPSTITGSIGVVAAIPDVSKTLKTVGVNVEVVGKGPHAEELSFLRNGASPFLKKAITESMQRVYESFVAKASAGRKLDPATRHRLRRQARRTRRRDRNGVRARRQARCEEGADRRVSGIAESDRSDQRNDRRVHDHRRDRGPIALRASGRRRQRHRRRARRDEARLRARPHPVPHAVPRDDPLISLNRRSIGAVVAIIATAAPFFFEIARDGWLALRALLAVPAPVGKKVLFTANAGPDARVTTH